MTAARARWTPDELAALLARECVARGLTDPDRADRRLVAASIGAGHVTEPVWLLAVAQVPVAAAAASRAAAGPACDFWAAAALCGARPAGLFLVGRRCPAHTPSALAGRPEPGAAAYGWPSRRPPAPRDGQQRAPRCASCLNPIDVVIAAAGVTVHPACGTSLDDRRLGPVDIAGLAASRLGA